MRHNGVLSDLLFVNLGMIRITVVILRGKKALGEITPNAFLNIKFI